MAEPATAMIGRGGDAPDARRVASALWREHAQAPGERFPLPIQEVERCRILPVDLCEGAALLHDEDVAAQLQHVMQLPRRQFVEPAPEPFSCAHAQ